MQDRYADDVGDFGKFGMLRMLKSKTGKTLQEMIGIVML